MPFPFGVSIGDFIVCIDLIKTVVESLQEAHGSASKYRGLVASLESLETALIRVRDIHIQNPVLRKELQHVAIKCRDSLSAFLAKVAKYEPSLKLGGSASCIKDSIRKIQWAVYAKEDIAFFQDEISAHMQAIMVLLLAIHSSSLEAVHFHVDQIAVAVVQQQRAERESLQMLICFGLMHCALEIRNAARMIILANLALFHALVRYARTGWDLPARVGLGEFSVLEDAFGRLMPIPTQFISDWQIFTTALRHKFAKDFEMPAFARNGRYILRYMPSYQEVPRGTAFSRVFCPGAHLVMTLVVMYDNDRAAGCPSCGTLDNGTAGITQRCACGSAYTRAKDLEDHILMLPAHSSQFGQLEFGKPDSIAVSTLSKPSCTQNLEQDEESATCEKPNHSPIFVYDDVRNIKNVDFSTPPMVLITDLWGHLYFVPWSIVKKTDGLMFILNHFSAGGSVLSWEDEYYLMNGEEEEITPGNWLQTAYPGVSIRLRLNYKDTGRSLRECFVTKIESELSTCLSTHPRYDLDSVIAHLCLTIGAADTQQELRQLITETATALCGTSSHTTQTPNNEYSASHPRRVCLLCRKSFPTAALLNKHVHSHLVPLRCPNECEVCDETDLPYFMNEDVAGRSRDNRNTGIVTTSRAIKHRHGIRRSRSVRSNLRFPRRRGNRKLQPAKQTTAEYTIVSISSAPAHKARHHPVFTLGPPAGMWVCCHCQQTNHAMMDRCPIDGHYRCHYCYVYAEPKPKPKPKPSPKPEPEPKRT